MTWREVADGHVHRCPECSRDELWLITHRRPEASTWRRDRHQMCPFWRFCWAASRLGFLRRDRRLKDLEASEFSRMIWTPFFYRGYVFDPPIGSITYLSWWVMAKPFFTGRYW